MSTNYNDDKKYFITNNIYIASALICQCFDYEDIKITNGETLYIFKNKTGINAAVNGYFFDTLSVNAKGFTNNLKELEKHTRSGYKFNLPLDF